MQTERITSCYRNICFNSPIIHTAPWTSRSPRFLLQGGFLKMKNRVCSPQNLELLKEHWHLSFFFFFCHICLFLAMLPKNMTGKKKKKKKRRSHWCFIESVCPLNLSDSIWCFLLHFYLSSCTNPLPYSPAKKTHCFRSGCQSALLIFKGSKAWNRDCEHGPDFLFSDLPLSLPSVSVSLSAFFMLSLSHFLVV